MAKAAEVEKMIARVMKKKDLSQTAAIDYMLTVATGRLAALWRYEDTLPEGKANKGILAVVGRKKRADRSTPVAAKIAKAEAKTEAKPKVKRKPKPKAPKQLEMSEAAQ